MCSQLGFHLGTFIFIMMFFPVSQLPNSHAVVKLNDPVLLTCSKQCSGDVKWMLEKRLKTLVSECKRGSCVEGHGFVNRTRLVRGELSLHLNRVMYNDKGWYICYCNDSEICTFHLDVVFPHPKRVCVGENVTLPCYADTNKHIPDNDINIQWIRDGELVVKLQRGKMSYGPGLEGRGFVTASQYKNGDLSLTILKVQQADGGTYRCIHRHEEWGDPDAVMLSIRESSECEAVKQSTFPWWGSLLLVVAFVALVGGLGYIFQCKLKRQKKPQSDANDERSFMMASNMNDES